MTEDEKAFGADAWVYCKSHVGPHSTGWCSVSADNKIKLDAKSREDAVAECVSRGLRVYALDKR